MFFLIYRDAHIENDYFILIVVFKRFLDEDIIYYDIKVKL